MTSQTLSHLLYLLKKSETLHILKGGRNSVQQYSLSQGTDRVSWSALLSGRGPQTGPLAHLWSEGLDKYHDFLVRFVNPFQEGNLCSENGCRVKLQTKNRSLEQEGVLWSQFPSPAAEVSVRDGYQSTPSTGTDQQKPLVPHSKRSQERYDPRPVFKAFSNWTLQIKCQVESLWGHP